MLHSSTEGLRKTIFGCCYWTVRKIEGWDSTVREPKQRKNSTPNSLMIHLLRKTDSDLVQFQSLLQCSELSVMR